MYHQSARARADLCGVNLRYANLSGANLQCANLSGANLDGANLDGVNLDGVNLEAVNIIDTGVYGIIVIGRTITSKLRGSNDSPELLAAIDALESLILAHTCGGVDICSPAYLEGIETAVDAIGNHYT